MSVITGIPDRPSKWDISLTQGQVAYVDEQDYPMLSEYRWYAVKDGKTFYAHRRLGDRPVSMHKVIATLMGIDAPEVDHIDRNGLNNCRSNLRGATRSENAANRTAKGYTVDTSGGRKKPYVVRVGGKYIGRFGTPEEAVEAYTVAKKEIYGVYGN